jgi:hypothetical protein
MNTFFGTDLHRWGLGFVVCISGYARYVMFHVGPFDLGVEW